MKSCDRFFRVNTMPNADGTFGVTEEFKDWKNASADRGGNRGDITGTP